MGMPTTLALKLVLGAKPLQGSQGKCDLSHIERKNSPPARIRSRTRGVATYTVLLDRVDGLSSQQFFFPSDCLHIPKFRHSVA